MTDFTLCSRQTRFAKGPLSNFIETADRFIREAVLGEDHLAFHRGRFACHGQTYLLLQKSGDLGNSDTIGVCDFSLSNSHHGRPPADAILDF
jgi:hypothetical protein